MSCKKNLASHISFHFHGCLSNVFFFFCFHFFWPQKFHSNNFAHQSKHVRPHLNIIISNVGCCCCCGRRRWCYHNFKHVNDSCCISFTFEIAISMLIFSLFNSFISSIILISGRIASLVDNNECTCLLFCFSFDAVFVVAVVFCVAMVVVGHKRMRHASTK